MPVVQGFGRSVELFLIFLRQRPLFRSRFAGTLYFVLEDIQGPFPSGQTIPQKQGIQQSSDDKDFILSLKRRRRRRLELFEEFFMRLLIFISAKSPTLFTIFSLFPFAENISQNFSSFQPLQMNYLLRLSLLIQWENFSIICWSWSSIS